MSSLGLDLSLTSPGIVILQEGVYYVYFFPIRKREMNFVFDSDSFKINSMNVMIADQITTFHKYEVICSCISDLIDKHEVNHVIIEGYSYQSQSSSMSKLYELGGIVRYMCHTKKVAITEIAPTRVKKLFSSSGRSDKKDMYTSFIAKGFPPLLAIFKVEKCKDIPNPVQDIVDAVALLHCVKK